MFPDPLYEWLGRHIIADRMREVEKDRLARLAMHPGEVLPLRDRVGRALVRFGCSLQGEPCRC